MKPESLARHELVGLSVTVTDARNESLIGLAGTVLNETMKTLVIRRTVKTDETAEPVTAQIPKQGTTFTFDLAQGGSVRVSGERLLANPVRRSETGGDSAWV